MSDLSRLLDDVYGDGSPAAPDWASDEVLDDAFASWVPGPSVDAPAAERAMLADHVREPEPAVEDNGVLDPPAPVTTAVGTFSDVDAAVAPLATVLAFPTRWDPSDDDILPRRGAKRAKAAKRPRRARTDATLLAAAPDVDAATPFADLLDGVEDAAPLFGGPTVEIAGDVDAVDASEAPEAAPKVPWYRRELGGRKRSTPKVEEQPKPKREKKQRHVAEHAESTVPAEPKVPWYKREIGGGKKKQPR